jgi:hypothetical protein
MDEAVDDDNSVLHGDSSYQTQQEQPYSNDSTTSCLLCEVKHQLAWLELQWGTTLEYRIPHDVDTMHGMLTMAVAGAAWLCQKELLGTDYRQTKSFCSMLTPGNVTM